MKIPKARKLKSGTWFIQLRLNGESVSVTANSEKECRRKAELIKAEYRAGMRQPQEPEPPKLPTLTEAIDSYIDLKSNVLSPSTIRGYRVIQRGRFKSLMDRSLSDITENEWREACNREAAICSAKTLSNSWRFIVTVCRQTAKVQLPEVTLPQVVPNERPFLDAEQIKVFIKAVGGTDVEIPALLALSSLRRSEICALTWENVDLANKRIIVKGAAVPDENNKLVQKKENKNKSSTRTIPILMDELYNALERIEDKQGLVITCAPDTIRRRIDRICKDNSLPLVGIHGLRHSFASLAYHLGVPEKITMEMGGWSDSQTMRNIYTHIAQSDIAKHENQFSNFFKNAN